MTDQEKIELIADCLEVESSQINLETQLGDLDEYDSMSKLSVIVLMDEEFNKKLTGETLGEFKTIGDILEFINDTSR